MLKEDALEDVKKKLRNLIMELTYKTKTQFITMKKMKLRDLTLSWEN